MRNLCMTVSYDGTAYNGFQIQPIGKTVQGEIERAMAMLTGEDVKIHGSGRTDAGVHARGQVFHVHTNASIPVSKWPVALNSRLPQDIVVLTAIEVPLLFHSRRSAKRKTYRYSIRTGKYPDVFRRNYEFHHYNPLRVHAMRDAMSALVGEHDFTTFTSIHSTKRSHVRTIYKAWLEEEGDVLHFYFTGNGFLYNMVRIIMGTLMRIGEGKMEAARMAAILAARDRSLAGPKAMAHGLTLWSVEYEELDFEREARQ
ncbi:tRNA pseudouridine(38-40) synthase TruA [Paenibacillus sp. IB182496]|uniref:tRNA pseudouridine synthase A n=1 Tax=Paenibacillus sabuli TaxID=2772509 RepID=A0A927GQN1_9BACL|nr:tRNA pseudouridine(38-40) synthase TruA [Paenibacillus sabuli]MBD2844694.1 tRNA pseudouridine(38-40) synthase TruA [Paenibacillus sabuli]